LVRFPADRLAALRYAARMPKAPINDPMHWRERAEAARTLADELTSPDSKRRMLRFAEDFEELARHAEQRLARHDVANTVRKATA
jgi:predicted Rossmann-fold nucleotide-binding protein